MLLRRAATTAPAAGLPSAFRTNPFRDASPWSLGPAPVRADSASGCGRDTGFGEVSLTGARSLSLLGVLFSCSTTASESPRTDRVASGSTVDVSEGFARRGVLAAPS